METACYQCVVMVSQEHCCGKTFNQGCGLGLDASVSRPSRGAVVPRLGLASAVIRNGLETERLGLGVGLDTEGLGLGLGSKRRSILALCI